MIFYLLYVTFVLNFDTRRHDDRCVCRVCCTTLRDALASYKPAIDPIGPGCTHFIDEFSRHGLVRSRVHWARRVAVAIASRRDLFISAICLSFPSWCVGSFGSCLRHDKRLENVDYKTRKFFPSLSTYYPFAFVPILPRYFCTNSFRLIEDCECGFCCLIEHCRTFEFVDDVLEFCIFINPHWTRW